MQMTDEFIKELQNASSEKEIHEFLLQLIHGLGLDYFLFGMCCPLSIIKSEVFTIDNYPPGWRKLYDKEIGLPADPILKYCAQNHSPIFWGRTAPSEIKAINESLFPTHQSGFAVPLHGAMGSFGVFCFSISSAKANSENILSEALTIIQIVLPYLQDAAMEVRKDKGPEEVQLTSREIECLVWATEGKSAWEIAKILGCSERTVTFHLNNATTKLDCTNRYQAIAKAILTGVITPRL